MEGGAEVKVGSGSGGECGSGSGNQRAFATPPADESSAGCTPEAGRVVPEQPETT